MTLEELLCCQVTTIEDLEKYFAAVGINHVKKKDLDRIIEKFGMVVFKLNCFSQVYQVISERETARVMHNWTLVIGVMTILYTVMTFLMLIKG